jgi:hypothetical protein
VHMCVLVSEREKVCAYVCACEGARESVLVCVLVSERESVCIRVCL